MVYILKIRHSIAHYSLLKPKILLGIVIANIAYHLANHIDIIGDLSIFHVLAK